MLREAAVAFDKSLSTQHANVQRIRSQATELELRAFSGELKEAETLFAAGHQLAADALAKSQAAEAGADTISDTWLAEMQSRAEHLELKMRRLSARLP